MIMKKARRRTKTEIGIAKLFEELGTLYFNTFEELAMMLGRADSVKLMTEVKKLEEQKKVDLEYLNPLWQLDYIPF